jgi:hypothetical protein
MSRRQWLWLWLGVGLTLLGVFKLLLIGWYLARQRVSTPLAVVCPSASAVCQLPGGVRLRFQTAPQEGHPFVMRLDGVTGPVPSAEFVMRNMDMGFNRYRFVAAGDAWQARVTLPVCSAGRHDWLMNLTVNGRRLQVALPQR